MSPGCSGVGEEVPIQGERAGTHLADVLQGDGLLVLHYLSQAPEGELWVEGMGEPMASTAHPPLHPSPSPTPLTEKLISSSRTRSPTTWKRWARVRWWPSPMKPHLGSGVRCVQWDAQGEATSQVAPTWQKSWWLSSETSRRQQQNDWVSCFS